MEGEGKKKKKKKKEKKKKKKKKKKKTIIYYINLKIDKTVKLPLRCITPLYRRGEISERQCSIPSSNTKILITKKKERGSTRRERTCTKSGEKKKKDPHAHPLKPTNQQPSNFFF